jgi:hypothetical protein
MRGRARTRARTTRREIWAWPRTLREAKPKAGTIAGIVRDCRRHGPTAGVKPRSRTDIKRPRSTAPAIIYTKAAGHPDENESGRGHANGQQARGPGRTEMSAKGIATDQRFTIHLAAGFSPCRPPEIGSNPAKGATPGAPPGGKREEPDRPARSRRFEGRVRNAACEKRPRRMTPSRTGEGASWRRLMWTGDRSRDRKPCDELKSHERSPELRPPQT